KVSAYVRLARSKCTRTCDHAFFCNPRARGAGKSALTIALTYGRLQAEQHRARERTLRRRKGVEKSERQPAHPIERCDVVAEQIDESIGERYAGEAIATTARCITIERPRIADAFVRRIVQMLRQLVRIAKTEVETLAGDRMQCLCRVAEQHHATLCD